jgi:hypothetical protein
LQEYRKEEGKTDLREAPTCQNNPEESGTRMNKHLHLENVCSGSVPKECHDHIVYKVEPVVDNPIVVHLKTIYLHDICQLLLFLMNDSLHKYRQTDG